MSENLDDIHALLEEHSKLEATYTDENFLFVESENWVETPFGELDGVRVYLRSSNSFDLDVIGGENRQNLSFDQTIHYLTSTLTHS